MCRKIRNIWNRFWIWIKGRLLFKPNLKTKSFYRAWQRTNRRSLWQKEGWFQDKGHNCLQTGTWSRPRSSSGNAQTLYKRMREQAFVCHLYQMLLSRQKRDSAQQCPPCKRCTPEHPERLCLELVNVQNLSLSIENLVGLHGVKGVLFSHWTR